MLPDGAHFWYKADDGLWWRGRISARTSTDGEYLVRFLDDPGPIKLPLSPAHCRTSTWGVQVAGAFNSVGIDQLHAGFKVTYMNLEARTWLLDGQAAIALEYLILISRF